MKKNPTKPAAKSPAPATKAATTVKPAAPAIAKTAIAPAVAVAPKPSPAPVAKPAAKKKTVTALPVVAPAPKPAAAAAPSLKPVATKRVVTTITAQIDIGFGNRLYLRGEGAGLSWDKGTLMNCLSDDRWELTLGESVRPIIFKFLVNDLSWSAGEDYMVAAGTTAALVPTF